MDFRIARSLDEAEGTNYVGIGPGKFNDNYWGDGRYNVSFSVFWLLDGIITKHFPDFDEYDINDIPKAAALSIISDWIEASLRLTGC